MYKFKKYIVFTSLLFFFIASSCTCGKNKKIDKLTLFVSNIQTDYKSFEKSDWTYFDKALKDLMRNIEKCKSEMEESEKEYVKKQIAIYEKVKIKWKIENIVNLN